MRASSLVPAIVMLLGAVAPAGAQQKSATLLGVVRNLAGAGSGAEIPPDPVGLAWIWLRR